MHAWYPMYAWYSPLPHLSAPVYLEPASTYAAVNYMALYSQVADAPAPEAAYATFALVPQCAAAPVEYDDAAVDKLSYATVSEVQVFEESGKGATNGGTFVVPRSPTHPEPSIRKYTTVHPGSCRSSPRYPALCTAHYLQYLCRFIRTILGT